MDEDASTDAAAAAPAGRPAPPTSRAIAMFVAVFAFFALLAAAAWFIGGNPGQVVCELDGLSGPNGEVYHRDPNQDCTFVDLDGNVLPGQ